MIDAIIEALNLSTNKGFFVLYKGIKQSAIKSVEIIVYELYFIHNDNKSKVFTFSRTRNKNDDQKTFINNYEKNFIKELTLFIVEGKIYEYISN